MEIIVAICNHKYILQLFPIKRGSSNRVSYSSLFVLAQCGQSSFEFALNVSIFSIFSSKKFEYRIFSNNAYLKRVCNASTRIIYYRYYLLDIFFSLRSKILNLSNIYGFYMTISQQKLKTHSHKHLVCQK